MNSALLVQREEKDDRAAEAKFVSEHGNTLARKVSRSHSHRTGADSISLLMSHMTQRAGNEQEPQISCDSEFMLIWTLKVKKLDVQMILM